MVHSCCCVKSIFISFLRLNNPLHVYIIFCLPTHLLMDPRVASTSWLLWIVLLWAWACKCLRFCFQFFCIYTKSTVARSWGSRIFTFSKKLPCCFPQWLHCCIFPLTVHKVPVSQYAHQHLLFSNVCLFDSSHTYGCEVVSCCGFDLHFLTTIFSHVFSVGEAMLQRSYVICAKAPSSGWSLKSKHSAFYAWVSDSYFAVSNYSHIEKVKISV